MAINNYAIPPSVLAQQQAMEQQAAQIEAERLRREQEVARQAELQRQQQLLQPPSDPAFEAAQQQALRELLKPQYTDRVFGRPAETWRGYEMPAGATSIVSELDPAKTMAALGQYKQIALDPVLARQKEAETLRLADEERQYGRKKDRLAVMEKLAGSGMTLDANDNIVPLQGKKPVAETVGSAEWKRIQEVEAAKNKVQTDAQKLADKEKGAATYLQGQQSAMQRQLADIAGLNVADFTPDQLTSYYGQNAPLRGSAVDRIENAAGVIDSLIPQVFRSQNKQDVLAGINSMKEVAQTFGLQQLRAAGVAPGSVTEREWSKFEQMLGNLDTSQSGERLYNQLRQIYNQLETAKSSLAPAQPQAAETAAPNQSGAQRQAQLMQEAQTAIANGADPVKVKERLNQLMQGQ